MPTPVNRPPSREKQCIPLQEVIHSASRGNTFGSERRHVPLRVECVLLYFERILLRAKIDLGVCAPLRMHIIMHIILGLEVVDFPILRGRSKQRPYKCAGGCSLTVSG